MGYKARIKDFCEGNINDASGKTRILFDMIEKDNGREFTPNEKYSYWMGYKRAMSIVWSFINDMKEKSRGT